MNILYRLIYSTAEKTFEGDPLADFTAWTAHYIKTATTLRDEMRAEGLNDTADALDVIIAEQSKFSDNR